LTISAYSTALFATWYFLEELGILLDAGDSVVTGLLQKSRKINHVFISHADRDHLTGLLQLNQLNARPGFPVIYYPANSSSFPALEAFSKKFDQQVEGTVWKPVTQGEEIWLRDDLLMIPIRNGHVNAPPEITRSLSYQLIQTKRKLKPELAGLSGAEIRDISLAHGKESTTVEVRTPILGYSGDTPVEDPTRWDNTGILIHEATFFGDHDEKPFKNKHSRLEEVLEMVSGIHIEKLILGHFSSRYHAEDIDRRIKELCEHYAINIPVYRILPGETVHDVFNTARVY
jgi:ribonuclease Z